MDDLLFQLATPLLYLILAFIVMGIWSFFKGNRDARIAAEKEAARATRERDEAKRQQRIAEGRLRAGKAFARLAGRKADADLIGKTAGLELEEILELAVVVGRRQQEGPEEHRERKALVVKKRAALWRSRDERYGTSLLSLVEEQGGLCGNPDKDEGGWGCGCWLYALPPGTVHVDHIEPRKHGGTDDPGNLQALCHTCNTAKGARTEVQERVRHREGTVATGALSIGRATRLAR